MRAKRNRVEGCSVEGCSREQCVDHTPGHTTPRRLPRSAARAGARERLAERGRLGARRTSCGGGASASFALGRGFFGVASMCGAKTGRRKLHSWWCAAKPQRDTSCRALGSGPARLREQCSLIAGPAQGHVQYNRYARPARIGGATSLRSAGGHSRVGLRRLPEREQRRATAHARAETLLLESK